MIKKIFLIIIAALLSALCAPHAKAQTTEGTEFWLTYGSIFGTSMSSSKDLRIRIIAGSQPTTGWIYFTHLKKTVPLPNIAPHEIYTYSIGIEDDDERYAVYNSSMGKTDFSIRITTTNPVSVYASSKAGQFNDVTNVLPVTALGTEYYQISYHCISEIWNPKFDAYAVIATQNGTQLSHNGDLTETLNAGDVYYRTFNPDMTGHYITATADKPVAFFALNQGTTIPQEGYFNILFQQLAPVHTWGKTFLVPVTTCNTEYVRIVASQPNTTITQFGGTLLSPPGGQTGYTINAGQFIQLEITQANNGCYIYADKPIGVCSYLLNGNSGSISWGCSQVWIPPIEQTTPSVLMAPFVQTPLSYHYAIISTSTTAKPNTTVSVGGAPPIPLSVSWSDNADAGRSFCNYPLTDLNASYVFSNPAEIIVLGYGLSGASNVYVSYYYLAGSSMRNLSAAFTANKIPDNKMSDHLFCEHEIEFIANIEGRHPDEGSLKWYIDDPEPFLIDETSWSHPFAPGIYIITMEVKFEDESIEIYEGILNIGAVIEATPFPIEGGSVKGDGCFWEGEMVNLVATPADGYKFMEWREDDLPVSPAPPPTYSFPAEEDRSLVAHFAPMFCGGTGTPTDPYLICNAEQLDSVRLSDFLDKHFKLAKDIPLSAYLATGGEGYNKWGSEGWEPIGTDTEPFTGSLNGDGHKITGLWINRTGDYIGLFGFIDGAVIRNVGLIISD